MNEAHEDIEFERHLRQIYLEASEELQAQIHAVCVQGRRPSVRTSLQSLLLQPDLRQKNGHLLRTAWLKAVEKAWKDLSLREVLDRLKEVVIKKSDLLLGEVQGLRDRERLHQTFTNGPHLVVLDEDLVNNSLRVSLQVRALQVPDPGANIEIIGRERTLLLPVELCRDQEGQGFSGSTVLESWDKESIGDFHLVGPWFRDGAVSLPGPSFFDALREFFRNLGDPSTILVAPWETGFARRGNTPEANGPEQSPGVQVGTVTGQGLAEMGTAWKLTMPGRRTCVAQLHEDGILLNAGKDVLRQLESTKVTFRVLEDGNAFIRFSAESSTSEP